MKTLNYTFEIELCKKYFLHLKKNVLPYFYGSIIATAMMPWFMMERYLQLNEKWVSIKSDTLQKGTFLRTGKFYKPVTVVQFAHSNGFSPKNTL